MNMGAKDIRHKGIHMRKDTTMHGAMDTMMAMIMRIPVGMDMKGEGEHWRGNFR
jgi:hypothetical protein